MATTYPLPYVVNESARKRQIMNNTPLRYLVSAMFAGALIAVVLWVSLMMGQILHLANQPMYYVATAGFFGVALCTIIFCRCELFTSNVMYMSVGAMTGQLSVAEMLKSWFLVYVGNFLGAALFCAILSQTGALANLPAGHILFDVIGHKIHPGFFAIFCKGILCNWIICLAVWVPMRLTNEMAKLAMIMLLVFVFFFSGYEHSIANMAFFNLSWFSGAALPNLAETLHNMIPATLGNIVGGAVCVGALNVYLERETLEPVAASSEQPAASASLASHS